MVPTATNTERGATVSLIQPQRGHSENDTPCPGSLSGDAGVRVSTAALLALESCAFHQHSCDLPNSLTVAWPSALCRHGFVLCAFTLVFFQS